MTLSLDAYRDCLAQADPRLAETLEAGFAEAARVMGPAGLQAYLDGGKALCDLGRGSNIVVAYLEAMPAVAKEVGDEAIGDAVTEAMKLASMVSGEVIALILATLPTAARRLGDAALLRAYLGLLHQLSAKAPRGLRPMLGRLDDLFGKLTLGGLRRWATWGAQAHGRDLKALEGYFGLQSADSLAVLQKERRGTLFVDSQRRLNLYLRALWGRDFFLRPTSGDFETRQGYQPYIENGVIHLPDAFDDWNGLPGRDLYRAAAAHAAAHMVYTRAPISAEQLNPVQMAFIGAVEDARIERLAIRDFPGLRALWRPFIRLPQDAHPAVEAIQRLGIALMDGAAADDAAREFEVRFAAAPFDNRLSWDVGISAYNRLVAEAGVPGLRALEGFAPPYRDDNRFVWEYEEIDWSKEEVYGEAARQVRRTVNVMEMVNEVDTELAGDDAQEIWTLESEFFRDGDPAGMSLNRLEGKEPAPQPHHYPEWDYQVQLHRPDWATVLEKRPRRGDPARIEDILIEQRPVAQRLRRLVDALQPRGVLRLRRQEDGDDIDIDAAVRAMTDVRLGRQPDPRINIRHRPQVRDIAVLLLLDLSESTNETPPGADRPVLELAREATTLLAWAVDGIGDPFAVHGFASDGRHDVQYFRFKDFAQPWDDGAKARLAGMAGGLSTRMGAALRHAGGFLRRQPQRRKLLLLVSDGEPADIDVRDPQYLRHDTRKAVEELQAVGVTPYCLTLDPRADDYVGRIFGANRYTVLDQVARLPERLPAVFAGLTR